MFWIDFKNEVEKQLKNQGCDDVSKVIFTDVDMDIWGISDGNEIYVMFNKDNNNMELHMDYK